MAGRVRKARIIKGEDYTWYKKREGEVFEVSTLVDRGNYLLVNSAFNQSKFSETGELKRLAGYDISGFCYAIDERCLRFEDYQTNEEAAQYVLREEQQP